MTDAGRSESATSADAGDPNTGEFMREQRLQRNLKIAIGFLTFLILGGLAAIIIKIFALSSQPETPNAELSAAASTSAARADVALQLPAGARIVSVSAAGGRIVVHHESPSGSGIAVLDIASGKRLYGITPVDSPAR